MDNQEAIKILGQYDVSDLHFYTTDGEEIPFTEWSDAIETAIFALQAQYMQPTCNQLAHPDLSGYSDKLWRAAYERGKAERKTDEKDRTDRTTLS